MINLIRDIFLLIIASLGAVLISYFIDPNDLSLGQATVHPLFFVAVIFSSFYGLRFAIASSVYLIVLYFLCIYFQVDFEEVESFFMYNHIKLPILLLLSSVLIGQMKTRNDKAIKKLERRNESLRHVNNSYKLKLNDLDKILLEVRKRYATARSSITDFVSVLSQLVDKNEEAVYKELEKTIVKHCAVQKAHFLSIKECHDVDFNSDEGKLIELALNQKTLVTIKDELFLNTFEKSNDRSDLAVIVAPVVIEGSVLGVYQLYGLNFLDFNSFTTKKIRSLIYLLESVLIQLREAERVRYHARYNTDYELLKNYWFQCQCDEMAYALSGKGVEVFKLKIIIKIDDVVSSIVKSKVMAFVAFILNSERRELEATGLISDHQMGIALIRSSEDRNKLKSKIDKELKSFSDEIGDECELKSEMVKVEVPSSTAKKEKAIS